MTMNSKLVANNVQYSFDDGIHMLSVADALEAPRDYVIFHEEPTSMSKTES
jgi:hypothetical protein